MIEEIEYKLNSSNPEKPSGRPQASVLIAILNYGEYIESPELIYTLNDLASPLNSLWRGKFSWWKSRTR